jgi:hypothetical protein
MFTYVKVSAQLCWHSPRLAALNVFDAARMGA